MLYIDIMNQKKRTLQFEDLRHKYPGVICHVRCHEVTPSHSIFMHDHDFYEIECGIDGEAIQNLNGTKEKFCGNNFYMLRPEDCHEITGMANRKLTYFNIAFERERLEEINRRYQLTVTSRWLSAANWPRRQRLLPGTLMNIRNAIYELYQYRHLAISLDRFLYNMFFELEKECLSPFSSCPEWLQESIWKLDSRENLYRGPRALAEISGYSLEYVSRTLKKFAGLTACQVVNMIKMERASALLIIGNADICVIAHECGIESMSYFFKLFKATYGVTPFEYRARHGCVGVKPAPGGEA